MKFLYNETRETMSLIEIHNQYIAGLITFSEFMIAALNHMIENPQAVTDLIEVNHLNYPEMIAWEKEMGLFMFKQFTKPE